MQKNLRPEINVPKVKRLLIGILTIFETLFLSNKLIHSQHHLNIEAIKYLLVECKLDHSNVYVQKSWAYLGNCTATYDFKKAT